MTQSGTSLADPNGSDSIVTALSWIQGTLLGTVATVVAVLAIASIGFLMLAGRIDLRHGVRMVLGCFILFGASAIAGGIQAGFAVTSEAPPLVPREHVAMPEPSAPPPAVSDPYAGASVAPR